MPLLEISQLRKSFIGPEGGEHRIIDVKYFTLAAKAHIAVQGESGSGKTTFLHLIAGILKPDSGTVLIGGEEVSRLKESQRDRLRAGMIGYIFQSFNLLQGYTCLEKVLLAMSFGRGVKRDFAEALLKRAILASIYNSINERRREIAILRALGARRIRVIAAILLEAASISTLGAIAGFAIYAVIVTIVAEVNRTQTGIVLDPLKFDPVLWWAPAVLVALGTLAGTVPAYKAYRTEVAEHLAPIS